ncbi:MAG: YigZ family protein [Myxococcota bacterium]
MPTRTTIADGDVRITLPRIKGSRFLAVARRVRTLAESEAFVAEIQAEHPNATHNAFAWQLTDAARAGDDGEVRGTAGAPILQHINGAGLVDVAIVVTRYYGGTKLGKGGLIRAYGAAAAAAIDAAEHIEEVTQETLTISCDYKRLGPLQGVIQQLGGTIQHTRYGDDIVLQVSIPTEQTAALRDAIRERSAGRAQIS